MLKRDEGTTDWEDCCARRISQNSDGVSAPGHLHAIEVSVGRWMRDGRHTHSDDSQ